MVSPFVEVEIVGVEYDCLKVKTSTIRKFIDFKLKSM